MTKVIKREHAERAQAHESVLAVPEVMRTAPGIAIQGRNADGATNQAAVVEELTATVEGVSEQVEQNSKSAKEISGRVE